MLKQLPSRKEMYDALLNKDSSFEGIFFAGIKTTGIFCRPACPARKPKIGNVEFFQSAKEALDSGYRPCKRCNPMQTVGKTPEWVGMILKKVEQNPAQKWTDREVKLLGVEPNRLRRWFKRHHGMTFHGYVRLRRLGRALKQMKHERNTALVAFDNGYESLSGFREAMKDLLGQPVKKGKNTLAVYLNRISTPLGPMLAGTTESKLCLLEFTDRRMLETQLKRIQKELDCTFIPGSNAVTEQVAEELEEYFEGERKEFSVPLELKGSEFRQKVWRQLQEIPYGETRSYKEQAQIIGNEKAVRAVAGANGDNRIAIIIPCHRVIGSNGTLTGYGGGLWRKRYLLNLERSHLKNRCGPGSQMSFL